MPATTTNAEAAGIEPVHGATRIDPGPFVSFTVAVLQCLMTDEYRC